MTDAAGDVIGWVDITVRENPALASTGVDLGASVPIALGLLMLGLVFIGVTRGRRRPTTRG